jgi:hypothetical protein
MSAETFIDLACDTFNMIARALRDRRLEVNVDSVAEMLDRFPMIRREFRLAVLLLTACRFDGRRDLAVRERLAYSLASNPFA